MGRFMVKFGDDEYLEWSTIVDAPVTYMMDADEAQAYLVRASVDGNGRQLGESWGARWQRLNEIGVTAHFEQSAEDAVVVNRAGRDECELTFDQIRRRYASPEAREDFDKRGHIESFTDSYEPTWTRHRWIED